METLLLTACIDPSSTSFVKRAKAEERLADYIGSLIRWIDESDFDQLVFCENSGYPYDYGSLQRRARLKGKGFEVLVFDGNKESASRGKGFGEGEILEYAVKKSAYLNQARSFYKVTGRLFVSNINRLLKINADKETIFQRYYWSYRAVDTRFFKSSLAFFNNMLIDAYQEVDDGDGRCLEYVYWDRLKRLRLPTFGEFPDIVGISATNNEPYTLAKRQLRKNNYLIKVGYFNVHEAFFLRSSRVRLFLRALKARIAK